MFKNFVRHANMHEHESLQYMLSTINLSNILEVHLKESKHNFF